MGKKVKSQQEKEMQNLFTSTLKEIKKLNYESLSQKEKRIEDKKNSFKKKNQKMPIYMLKGIRNKAIQKYKTQQEEMKKSGVLYDSSVQKIDLSWYKEKQKKKEKALRKHEYNSYKYKGANNKKSVASFSKGVLKISEKDIKRIQNMK